MTQKTQTLIIYPNGDVAKRMNDFLYKPISNTLILKDEVWNIYKMRDEFETDGWLVRKIHLTK
jgi:hypothetical protein